MIAKGTAATRSDIPTASMADIAFLLLIFFLVTTVFDEERGLQLVLPDPIELPVSQKNILHMVVRGDGVIEVSRGEGPRALQVQPEAIRALWRLEAARNPALIAAVKTEPDAPYHRTVAVLDALKTAGAERISLQMLSPRP